MPLSLASLASLARVCSPARNGFAQRAQRAQRTQRLGRRSLACSWIIQFLSSSGASCLFRVNALSTPTWAISSCLMPLILASLASLARVYSRERKGVRAKDAKDAKVRKAITGRVGTGRSTCLFRTVFCWRKGDGNVLGRGNSPCGNGRNPRGEIAEEPRSGGESAAVRW